MIKKILKKLIKVNGISVLIAAQNEEKTIRLCVESFLEFGDEIIIVTNGSTDNTRDICKELVKEYPVKVQFYDKPDLPDLYHNRAFALKKSKYRWIMRGDADFIAYTAEDGKEHDIINIRKVILKTSPFYPTLFSFKFVNLSYDFIYCRKDKIEYGQRLLSYDTPLGTIPNHRVYLNTWLLQFKRLGRWEGTPYLKLYRKIKISQPYFFHCTIKTDKDLFYRTERTNWRELGNYNKYPTLESYIFKYVLKKMDMSLEEAIKEYIDKSVLPSLEKYDENKFLPYPKSIKKVIDDKIKS